MAAYPLLPAEQEALLTLVACRLSTSAAMGAYSFSLEPENAYLQYHAEPAWRALATIRPSSPFRVSASAARTLKRHGSIPGHAFAAEGALTSCRRST